MTTSTYERDFHAWSQEQADLLRARSFAEIDLDHLIEELDAMGARSAKLCFASPSAQVAAGRGRNDDQTPSQALVMSVWENRRP
jgi:hypothetical protein